MLVIRHGWAGHASDWEGDDRRRPLDERGRGQAAALVAALAGYPVARIVSSPYDRCVQTVEPLAEAHGLELERAHELGEDEQSTAGVVLVRELLAEPVAVCVHGGLSDAAFGESQKKGETLVVDTDGRVIERIRV